MSKIKLTETVGWQGAYEGLGHQRVPVELHQHPREIICRLCFSDGFIEDCKNCSGTGREPMPFSEVWGIE